MVKIGLMIKANLKNVSKLYPHEPEQFCWPLKVRCTGCGEEDQNWHLISQDEVVELANGEAHFLYKCKCCSRDNHMSILPSNHVNGKAKKDKMNVETVYLDEDDEKFKTVICFDCRGLELTDFEPRDGWAVQSGKKVFEDVDLSEKEWVEYNDVDGMPVEITNIEHKFITVK
ncbi:UNVERIFIED_CONTAM: hypothetical protein PYX00_004698 [Menopon gallinae]|uniref:Uncharacterized protein n=1 Tax=Menopon gallinae TaxID=328185 RepID=A0AAW2I5I1_9NEOP